MRHGTGKNGLANVKQLGLPVIRQFAIDAMMDLVRSDLELLDVRHDVFTSERKLVEADRVDEVLENLTVAA